MDKKVPKLNIARDKKKKRKQARYFSVKEKQLVVDLAYDLGYPDEFGAAERTAKITDVPINAVTAWLLEREPSPNRPPVKKSIIMQEFNANHRGNNVQLAYSDQFIARATVLCEANGWPLKKGAIRRTARELDVPVSTLISWLHGTRRDSEALRSTRAGVKSDLVDLLGAGALTLFRDALDQRDEMSAYQKVIAAGIATDKLVNLTGGLETRLKVEVLHKIEQVKAPWELSPGDEVVEGEVKPVGKPSE